MRIVYIILAVCLITFTLQAQILKGRICDTKGEPVPNATLYIRENALGIMSDGNGDFQTKINKGNYTCEFSSLGYEKKIMNVSVPEEGTTVKVELKEKTYSLREVTVSPGKEDPAYRIMRNVIARAPYYLHQIKNYDANVYLKGSFKIEKVPYLIKTQIKDKEFKNMIGKLFLVESQNTVKYTEPDKYEQHVVAMSSSIPKSLDINDNVPMSIIMNNIYAPSAFGGLLAPGSFGIYKFHLENAYNENGHLINKIRVIPKKNNNQLVNGYIYVVDDSWMIEQVDLSTTQMGITVKFRFSYNEIKTDAFLPTAYDIAVSLNLLGMKGNGRFYASLQYKQVTTNNNFDISKTAATDTKNTPSQQPILSKKQKKDLQKLEELSQKDKLTTREAYKMARLMEKTVESDEVKAKKRNLEIRRRDSLITVTRDSLALNRDSVFWTDIRQQPLNEEELQSYMRRDSLKTISDSIKSADSLKNRTPKTWFSKILLGEKFKIKEKYFIEYDGILGACPEYNFVDGFWLGQSIKAGINFDKNRSLTIKPAVYYTTARKKINWQTYLELEYAPMRNGKFSASAGYTTADYAGLYGTNRVINSISSLVFGINAVKLYQSKYFNLSNSIDIANGLILTTKFKYDNRHRLEYNTTYNFVNKTPSSNRPHGETSPMPDNKAYTVKLGLRYTPRYYYTIDEGRKRYRHSSYPTMSVNYEHTFGSGNNGDAAFDKIEASISQSIKLNIFNSLYYGINAGTFLSAKQTYLPDYRHFNSNELFITEKSLYNSFNMMNNYINATNDKWLQAHVAYESNYLILKQIPFLQRYLFNEAIHIHTLWLPDQIHNEIGYSIGLGDMRIGVFAGFKGLKYESTGLTICLPLIY